MNGRAEGRLSLQWACDQAHAAGQLAGLRAYELWLHREAVREGREQIHGSTPDQVRVAVARAELAGERARLSWLRAATSRDRAAALAGLRPGTPPPPGTAGVDSG